MEYAILMKKEAKRDDFFIYHPITIINGHEDKRKGLFRVGNKQAFLDATDLNFAISEINDCYAYTISEEDLKKLYNEENIENAKEFFLEEIMENMHIGVINNTKNTIELHQIPYEQFYDLIQNPILTSFQYGETVTMTKQMLYMITQNKSKQELLNTIKQIEIGMEKLKKQHEIKGTKKVELAPNGEFSKTLETDENLTSKTNIIIPKEMNPQIRKDIDIEELETYIKERIFGQDECIEDLVTIIAENYKTKDRRQIIRPLIIGPTGCGKTETLEIIAEYLDIPYTKFPSSSLSAAGYEGKNIEDILKITYQNSGYNEKRCQDALIFLDEIDKIAIRGRDVSDEAVQNLLLTFLGGQVYDVPINSQKHVKIDTSLMNIICGGAFSEMIKAKERIIGFWSPEEKKDRYYHASTEDLINYGFIPEFIGRTNKLFFNKLTDNDIIAILTKSKISPLILKQQLYKDIYGVDLKYDQSYLNEIIKITKQLDTGARSIKETVFNSLIKVSHELQLKKNQNIYKSVIISGETVKDNKIYQLKR